MKPKMHYECMNRSEIQRLARDVVDGKVFGSWDVDSVDPEEGHQILMQVFLPFATWTRKQADAAMRANIYQLFEYLEKKSGEKDGLPMFLSMRTLSRQDYEALKEAIATIQSAAPNVPTIGNGDWTQKT